MTNPFQALIDRFSKKGVRYWLFSKATMPSFARARNDIPVEIVDDLSEEEAGAICDKIQRRLSRGRYYEIYIRVLMRLNDQSAVEVLKMLRCDLKERRWESEVSLVTEAIDYLESCDKPLAPRRPFRLTDVFGFFKSR